jgi:hypothetical protein
MFKFSFYSRNFMLYDEVLLLLRFASVFLLPSHGAFSCLAIDKDPIAQVRLLGIAGIDETWKVSSDTHSSAC